jgi:hypothetical protein
MTKNKYKSIEKTKRVIDRAIATGSKVLALGHQNLDNSAIEFLVNYRLDFLAICEKIYLGGNPRIDSYGRAILIRTRTAIKRGCEIIF